MLSIVTEIQKTSEINSEEDKRKKERRKQAALAALGSAAGITASKAFRELKRKYED